MELAGTLADRLAVVEVVQRMSGDLTAGQATDGVVFESSDPAVVRVEDGVAVPVGDGTATITAPCAISPAFHPATPRLMMSIK